MLITYTVIDEVIKIIFAHLKSVTHKVTCHFTSLLHVPSKIFTVQCLIQKNCLPVGQET